MSSVILVYAINNTRYGNNARTRIGSCIVYGNDWIMQLSGFYCNADFQETICEDGFSLGHCFNILLYPTT